MTCFIAIRQFSDMGIGKDDFTHISCSAEPMPINSVCYWHMVLSVYLQCFDFRLSINYINSLLQGSLNLIQRMGLSISFIIFVSHLPSVYLECNNFPFGFINLKMI